MCNLDKVIDIRAIASRALDDYTDSGNVTDEQLLADALDKIAEIVGFLEKKEVSK